MKSLTMSLKCGVFNGIAQYIQRKRLFGGEEIDKEDSYSSKG